LLSSLHESCGVFGIYAPGEDIARITFFGLFALQHRGQESAGIASWDGDKIQIHTHMGLVAQAFTEHELKHLGGDYAIGHTRYSTTGSSKAENAQPLLVQGLWGELALAHNGNLINAKELRDDLQAEGMTFRTSTDSEVIAQVFANAPGKDWFERARYAMRLLKGAYSLTILTREGLMAVRDPLGVRPLCIGTINGGWVFASESCALDHIGAKLVRQVEPGEVVLVNQDGIQGKQVVEPERRAACAFEFIYFARPDSQLDGKLLYPARMAMGAELAKEHPVEADIVIGIPDSATAAAIGYSQASGILFSEGLLKNRYVGRTFIQPDQRLRDMGVRLKFNPMREVLEGKRVIVVDDSIVRGTTTPHVVSLLRRAGAKEVHLRICAPPIVSPCHFGVDMATKAELIAAHHSVDEIRQKVGADSLGYLSIPGLIRAIGLPEQQFCLACFTGKYPIPVQLEMDKLALEVEAAAPHRR